MNQFGDDSFTGKLDEILHLTQENNRMLKAIRREKWLGVLTKVLVWGAVLVASYYFTMQYLNPILNSVQQVQNVTNSFTGAKTTTQATSSTGGMDIQKAIELFNQYKGTVGQ